MRNVFVCAPYAPNPKDSRKDLCQISENIEKMRQICRLITLLGDMPLAPHLYIENWTDDFEKTQSMAAEWVRKADVVYVVGRRITPDMIPFLDKAKEYEIPVQCVADPEKFYEQLEEAVKNIPDSCDVSREECHDGK